MRLFLFLGLAIAGCSIDLWTKQAIFGWLGNPGESPPYWLIEPYVGFQTAVNMGALFGLGQGFGWLFSILSIVAAIGIVYWLFVLKACKSLWLTIAMGLVMGGIFGNLYDRLGIPDLPKNYKGGVRDWILFTYDDYTWPNFNIADSLLVTGAIMLAIYSFLATEPREDTSKAKDPVATQAE
jgi:signal peptidase II